MAIKMLGVERKAQHPISNILYYHLEMTCYQLLRLFLDSLKWMHVTWEVLLGFVTI